jgi:hypothetical protein
MRPGLLSLYLMCVGCLCLQVAGAVQESYYFKVNGLLVKCRRASTSSQHIMPSSAVLHLTWI